MAFLKTKYASEPSFLFHHIPKTAGTSFMAYLHNWFHVFSDYQGLYGSREDFRMHPVDLNMLSAANVLAGHWNTPPSAIDLRYPNLKGDSRFYFFSFLRDPLQMHISMFNYRWKMDPIDCERHEKYSNLSNYIRSVQNEIANLMGCNQYDFENILDRYFFIGVTEKMNESLRVFKNKTLQILEQYPESAMAKRQIYIINNKPDLPTQRLNVVNRKEDKSQISQDDVEYFMGRNTLDYEIYKRSIDKLEADLNIN
jgi:hypothetical protein